MILFRIETWALRLPPVSRPGAERHLRYKAKESRTSLEDWGNIGEVIGAVAVIISVLYLAWQIRQNTEAVRASAVDSSISHLVGVRQSISEQELFRFRLLCHNMLLSHWNIFAQSGFAGLTKETWNSQRPVIRRMLSTEGGTWFWATYREEVAPSFQEEVDRILGESPVA